MRSKHNWEAGPGKGVMVIDQLISFVTRYVLVFEIDYNVPFLSLNSYAIAANRSHSSQMMQLSTYTLILCPSIFK